MTTEKQSVKERIIDQTISLIEQSNGDIAAITTRDITRSLNLGVGLVNYHFQSKDHLIELCIERIISKTIKTFEPPMTAPLSHIDLLTQTAIQVFDFLFAHMAVAKISILGDFKSPKLGDNTIKTMMGFAHYQNVMYELHADLQIFALVSTMQAAFLNASISEAMFGYKLAEKKERDRFITDLVMVLFCPASR